MKLTSERLLTAALALVLAALAGLATLAWVAATRAQGHTEQAQRTQRSLTLLAALQAATLEAESAQRAHALTGDAVFLQRQTPAAQAANAQLADLRTLMAANAEQYTRLVALGPLLTRRFEAIAGAVDLRTRAGPAAVQQLEAAGEGRRLQERLRAAWLDLQTHAEADLASARQQADSARVWAQGALSALAALAMLASGLSLWRVRADQVTLRRAAADRHDAVERRRRASDELQRLFDAPLDALGVLDAEGRWSRVGAGGSALWGWGADELQGTPFIDKVAPEDRRKAERALAEAMANAAPATARLRWRHKNGQALTLQWSLQGSAATANLVAVARDVTEVEHLRSETQRLATALGKATAEATASRGQAAQAAQQQSAFLATVAQELRPPAAALAAQADALLHDGTRQSPEAARAAAALRDRARQLAEVITDLLDLAAIEAGRLALQREPFDLSESLHRVATQLRPQAERKGLELRLQIADDLGYARGDARRVEQVLARLLRHAIDGTASGHVGLQAQAQPGAALHIEVSDSGAGLTAEDIASLFTAWRPGEAMSSPERDKAGLKLAVSQQLAQLMGGDIQVSSVPQQGSRYVLTLPADSSMHA